MKGKVSVMKGKVSTLKACLCACKDTKLLYAITPYSVFTIIDIGFTQFVGVVLI